MKKDNSLVQGNIALALVKFTLPIICTLFLQTMYATVDLLIISLFSSVADVSAVSTCSLLMTTITALCTGLAMGTTILLGQKIGEKKQDEVFPIIINSVIMFMGIALVIMLYLLIFDDATLSLLNTPDDAWNPAKDYLFFCTLGIPMIFAYNILGSIFRGLGDSKTPLIAVIVAATINVVLDLVLIAGLNFGAKGAAIATVVAQTLSVIICIFIVIKKKIFNFEGAFTDFKFNTAYLKRVLLLGAPIALQSVLTSVSFLFITVTVNKFGTVYSAAVGLSEKLSGIMMLIPLSFMQSMSVFSAQNFGAGEYKRAKKGLFIGIGISFIGCAIMGVFAIVTPEILIGMFSKDLEVIDAAALYLQGYAIDCFLVPFLFCFVGYFNGCGKTVFVMAQGIIGAIAIRTPLTYLFSMIEPLSLFTIALATPSATLFQIIMLFAYYFYNEKKNKNALTSYTE